MALRIIRTFHSGQRPLRILDAGCGSGQLAGPLQECGHSIVGVDASHVAVDRARIAWPRVTFRQAPLEELDLDRLFDVILSVDVFFHIVDDEAWTAALTALARHCKLNGTLVLTDTWQPLRFNMGNYIVHRSRAEYESVLDPLGFVCAGLFPYDYGGNPNAFAAFRRRAD